MTRRAELSFAISGYAKVYRVLPRFFAPELDPARGIVVLDDDESRHLVRVLRMQVGEEVAVFDGRGREYLARVDDASKRVRLTLVTALTPARDPRVRLTLVPALLKGGGMDDVIRDATMMGAAAIQPIVTAHTIAKPPSSRDRWQRVALAAAKQSRRATLPVIDHPRTFADWLAASFDGTRVVCAEPGAGVDARKLREISIASGAALVVGPEGGWSAEEIQAAAAAGAILATLGPMTLRAESMPIAALAAAIAVWD